MNSFLDRARHDLMGGNFVAPVTVVTGSSAADLDSITGSVCYAYLLGREGGQAGLIFPYLPIPRKDLSLRSEVVRLFEREGVRESALVFADDVDLADLLETREGELILVDNQGNDLAPALRGRIAEVIDHHRVLPRNLVENPVDANYRRPLRRRIVEPVGSTCTLVAEQILQRKSEILDRQLATLLLAALLLDTVKLDPNAGRATAKDREIAELLIQVGSVDITALYDQLALAHFDVGALSSTQLLAKDYKERMAGAVRFGMSSVPLLLESWRRRDKRLWEVLYGFLAEKELDLLVVLLYGYEGVFRRQLVFCTADEHLLSHVVARLAEPLGLAEISAATAEGEGPKGPCPAGGRRVVIRSFAQRESGVSRKRIEPRLREILESQ